MRKVKSIQVGLDFKSTNPCRVTIWYEDALAHARALEVCEEVAQQVHPQLTFNFTGCRMGDLEHSVPATQAIQAAANADIVLISTHGAALPPKAHECLEACALSRTKTEGALAWLMSNPSGVSSSAEALSSSLRQAARRLGMDFLPPGIFHDLPKPTGPPANLPFTTLAALNESDPAGYSHWGLNE